MRALFVAIVTALAMTLAVASPANAATSGLCWVGGVQTARLSVSKWSIGTDSVGNIKWRYHIDLNSGGKYSADALFFRGAKQSGWNDRYIDSWNSPSTITGRWTYPYLEESAYASCSVVV